MILHIRKRSIWMILFTIVITLSFVSKEGVHADSQSKAGFVFFYSTTCSSCHEVMEVLGDSFFEESNAITHNISESDYLKLLMKYCQQYNVKEDETGVVPIAFVGDTYLYGQDAILDNIRQRVQELGTESTTVYTLSDDEEVDVENKKLSMVNVFFAGLVNGINPCSLAMFFFFLSLVLATDTKMIYCAYSYLIGKFISFFLLGSLFYNVLYAVNIAIFENVTKMLIVIVALVMIILNVHDFTVSTRHKYDKNILQLPKGLVKLNHNIMRRVSGSSNTRFVFILCLGIGFMVAFGEFLCTGQVYLASIISMIHLGQGYTFQTVLYLLLYDLAFILPMWICVFVVHKGKNTRHVSEFLVRHIHVIKLINAFVFAGFAVFYLFF